MGGGALPQIFTVNSPQILQSLQYRFPADNRMVTPIDPANDGKTPEEDRGALVAAAGEGSGRLEDDIADGQPPPSKRARIDEDAAVSHEDIKQTVLKYKRKNGITYDVVYGEEESVGQGGESPLGINLATVKVKNAHTLLTHYYELANGGEAYRGRPPTASDQVIIVKSILDDEAAATTKTNVQRNDVLLFVADKLVNITDKKRLKYYKARINNGARPLKLTFFRPSEGEEEEPEEEDAMELDPSEALYVTKYEPPEETSAKPKAATGASSKEERQTRRERLQRRLEELEILHVETSTELSELRAQDGILDAGKPNEQEGEKISVKGDEDFIIPPHIRYYPPKKLSRKKLPALNEACNKVENLLRQRTVMSKEADKIRDVTKQAQMRLELKNKELEAFDDKINPTLEEVKLIEMEIQDNWKTMYLKLKDYYEEHGHCSVMDKEDNKLAKWATRQRNCYANAQMKETNPSIGIIKPYQVDLLNRLEFSWNPREQQFTQNLARLRVFKEEHGHANVPMKYEDVPLANFVQKWRREYRLFQEGKPSNMSQDRLEALEKAGFMWRDPSRTRNRSDTRDETWESFISQLEEFKAKYGHFMVNKVNKTLGKGNRLGRLDEFCGWVRKQYAVYKQGTPCQLTDEKVNQLKEMGFWLERSQAHQFAYSQKAFSPQKEDVAQLGQLKVPTMNDIANNGGGKTEEGAAEV